MCVLQNFLPVWTWLFITLIISFEEQVTSFDEALFSGFSLMVHFPSKKYLPNVNHKDVLLFSSSL